MTVAFAGTAPFGAAILEGLLERHDVAVVISQPDRPAGRGRKVHAPPVASLARERGLHLLQPERMHDGYVVDALRQHGVTIVVVAAFGQMVREPLLSDFLMLNVHGSLLPAYRGAAPIERSIMDGNDVTGVCIMRMDEGLDTGPVAFAGSVPIAIDDDAGTVYGRAADCGTELLGRALDAAADGTLTFTPQPDEGATYAHKIVAADRSIDFARPVREVHDQVRGLSPHIGAWCAAGDERTRVTLWKTRIVGLAAGEDDEFVPHAATLGPGEVWHDEQRMVVGCMGGALEVLESQPAGKRRMLVGEWLRGLRAPLRHLHAPAQA